MDGQACRERKHDHALDLRVLLLMEIRTLAWPNVLAGFFCLG